MRWLERLENYVAGTIGQRGNPVEISTYERVLDSLEQQGLIEKTTVFVEGYALNSMELVDGYKIKDKWSA